MGLSGRFWAVWGVVSIRPANLNKAHVKYLEARLIEEALAIGRVPLDNYRTPTRPGLLILAPSNVARAQVARASRPWSRIDMGKMPMPLKKQRVLM